VLAFVARIVARRGTDGDDRAPDAAERRDARDRQRLAQRTADLEEAGGLVAGRRVDAAVLGSP
jgi:hypothetical protein